MFKEKYCNYEKTTRKNIAAPVWVLQLHPHAKPILHDRRSTTTKSNNLFNKWINDLLTVISKRKNLSAEDMCLAFTLVHW